MTKQQTVKADWLTIDPAELSETAQANHAAYKAAYKQMKALRETFETNLAASADLPTGKRMIFGYNFGKLSIAIVDDDRKPASTVRNHTLASWLNGQRAAGSRT